jgi:PAS domain S-box-containing protein
MMKVALHPKGDIMSKLGSYGKDLFNSILSFHYLLPVTAVVLILILGAALYNVSEESGYMREQLRSDFNQQQLILARQAALRIDEELKDISAEVHRLNQALEEAAPSTALHTYMRTTLDYTHDKGLKEIGRISAEGEVLESVRTTDSPLLEHSKIPAVCLADESATIVLGPLQVRNEKTGETVVVGLICSPMQGKRFEGQTLYGVVDVTQLLRAATEGIRSGKTGYAWVLDEQGTFLYHPDRDFVGKNAFTARAEREPYISFNEINRIMKERMLTGEEGSGNYVSGWHRGVEGEMAKLIAYSPVRTPTLPPGRLWSVAVSAPTSEVAATVDKMRSRHLATEIAIIAVMFGFALLVVVYQRRSASSLKRQVSVQEEFISSVVQNSVDAIVFIDNDNQVKMWNKGAEMIFGYTADEMLGSRFRRLIPPDIDAEKELGRIEKEVREKGFLRNDQVQRITKSGKRITVNISRTMLHNKDGEPLGSTAIIKDVSEKVEMDKHIYNTEKLASIGILAAGVAHEINNPLAVILGFADLLKEKFEEGSSEREDLQLIEGNANHAKKIVENLLGFARVTEGMEDHVDINRALTTVTNIVQNTLMTKKVEFVTDIDSNLPPVAGDAREFQQVVFNLINNAVAAMDEDGGTLTIKAWAENSRVLVQVKDTGAGIPDRIKGQIFDPFFTTKVVGQGTGLGLSLCYGIVQKYGGRIDFTSVSREDDTDEPSGTTFTVSMPLYES